MEDDISSRDVIRIKNISLECGLNPDYSTTIFKCIIETVISRHNEIKSKVIDN